MNNLKRVNKILIFTLLIFSIFALASYSKSASKYFQDKDSIVFDTNLVSLYHNTGGDTVSLSIIKDKSDRNKATYLYTFLRNKEAFFEDEINNNIGEEYTIIVDSDCTITSVTSGKKSYDLPSNIKNKYTLKFNDAPQDEEKINVEYSCPVDLNTIDDIETNINIREKIEGDNSDFLYLYYNSKITKEEYRKIIDDKGIVMNYDTITIPDGTLPSEIKDSVRTWLKNYIDEYRTKNKDNKDLASIIVSGGPLSSHDATYNNPLEKYIYEKFGDFSDLNLDLLGLTVTHENDNYVLKLDDKFVGYALTDWHYSDDTRLFYFSNISTIDNDSLEKIFEGYMNKYYTGDVNKAMEYINNNGGIAAIIKDNKRVRGLYYLGGRLNILDSFMREKSPFNFDYSQPENSSILSSRRRELSIYFSQYYSDLIPESFVNLLTNNRVIGNTASEKRIVTSFNDYLVLNTNDNKVIINLYNDETTIYESATRYFDYYDFNAATTIGYFTRIDNKTDEELVSEVLEFSKHIDELYGTNYSDSINGTMLRRQDLINGVSLSYVRDSNNNIIETYATIVLVNSIEDYNNYPVGHVPDANAASDVSESPDTQEPTPDAPTSTTQNSGTTTTSTPDTQSSTQPTTTTTTSGKSGNDEGDNTLNPEPNITGAGGDDN